ncbi:hypothetical protein QUF90_15805 [Desulfococcaceae bacterium HSG9]|nr:hypothetical protein [Desulfococcaceae bacterium HSG9]
MRTLSKLIIVLLLSAASPGMTADFIQGQVIAIDREKGVLQLQLSGKNSGRNQCRCCALKNPNASAVPFIIHISPDRLPHCVRKGDHVFVWGAYLQNQKVGNCNFQAETVKSSCFRRYCDPTGVRARLGKCVNKGKKRRNGQRHRQGCQQYAAPLQNDNTSKQNAPQTYTPD